jgi:hypothetical protein
MNIIRVFRLAAAEEATTGLRRKLPGGLKAMPKKVLKVHAGG